MTQLSLYLFGSPRVALDGAPLHIVRRKATALLAYLAVSGQSHSRDWLATLLWPESDQSKARGNLRRMLSEIKGTLGENWLDIEREQARMQGQADLSKEQSIWLDVAVFQENLRVYEAHNHSGTALCPDCLPFLEAAVALYQDDFMAGFSLQACREYDEWQFFQAEELRGQLTQALVRLSGHAAAAQDYDCAIGYARRWLALDALHEPAHQQLMALYDQAGQRSAALRQYQVCRQILADELGVEPSQKTTDLYKHFHAEDLVVSIPSADTASEKNIAPSHNLPLELTSFIGRENEISQIKELLRQNRLVTLTGSGGVGKTRLSIQVAEELLDEFPDGIWYIELAPLSDPDKVPQTVAATLGLREDRQHTFLDILGNYLESRQVLLVLDNCEHLLTACASLTDNLLRQSSGLKICASSREPLGIGGEIPFAVPSLMTPNPNQLPELEIFKTYEAVRLFTERASVTVPSFQVGARNLQAIAQICYRLDGIPLALELAAPRLKILTTAQLASRLDNAFRLLTGGSRTALPRQQTLQATIDWSYQLLDHKERLLLQRLAVFAGGFSLKGAEQVCAGEDLGDGEIFDLLASLIDKSMVDVERDPNRKIRYRLLEMVRQYARQKLLESGQSQTVSARHLAFFLEMAELIEPQLRTSAALERLADLSQEAANLRAALSWALESEVSAKIEDGLRLASALLNFWHTQNFHNEGYGWLLKGLSHMPEDAEPSQFRAKACFSIGHLAVPMDKPEEAREWMEQSLGIYQLLEDPQGIITAQSMLGEIHAWSGSFDQARELGEASIKLARSLEDRWLLAWTLCRYGASLAFHPPDADSDQVRSLFEESLSLFEQMGDQFQVGDHYIVLGWITYKQGDLTSASIYFKQALATARAKKSKWMEAEALFTLGAVACNRGEFQQMKSLVSQSIALREEMGLSTIERIWALGFAEVNLGQTDEAVRHFKACLKASHYNNYLIVPLIGIARAMLQSNQPLIAAQLLGASQPLLDELNWFDSFPVKEFERAWDELQKQIDATRLKQEFEEEHRLTIEEAVSLALDVKVALASHTL